MKVLVDENIPYVTETFGLHADIQLFQGRELRPADMRGVDALIVRSTTDVDGRLLSGSRPSFVGTCTIGIDHMDTDYLEQKHIDWAYAPGCNAQSVVDYVLACLVTIQGGILPQRAGIVGCGNVGGLLRKKLINLGFDIRVYDPFLAKNDIPELTTLKDVFASELVCLHTPFTLNGAHPTAAMVGFDELVHLPENALLVSAGRGGVIIEDELMAFIKQRSDVQVVLDVWANEPVINTELMETVRISTPHIAGYSQEGKRKGTEMIYRAFCQHFGFQPVGLPELPVLSTDSSQPYADQLLQRYRPETDSRQMRHRWNQTSSLERETGSWFDELRKNYPERREFNG